MRQFDTGATRDTDEGKPDYLGFCSALVMRRYGEYMMKHQVQADGEPRSADNWKLGIPIEAYQASLGRHFVDAWLEFEGFESREGLEEALCAIIFNAQGLLYEILRERYENE